MGATPGELMAEPPSKRRRACAETVDPPQDDRVVCVTPAPAWSPPGATGVTLTQRHFQQLSSHDAPPAGGSQACQRPRLTDEVVNAVLELEETRCKQRGERSTLLLSSFFIESLGGTRGRDYSYDRVRRWHTARKLQLRCGVDSVLQLRTILIPANVPFRDHAAFSGPVEPASAAHAGAKRTQPEQVHHDPGRAGGTEAQRDVSNAANDEEEEDHWVLVEIQVASRTVRIYDSADAGTITNASWDVLRALQRWLADETAALAARSADADAAGADDAGAAAAGIAAAGTAAGTATAWHLERGDSPQRCDFTGDCGVFMLATAQLLARASGRPTNSEVHGCAPAAATAAAGDGAQSDSSSVVTATTYTEADIPRLRTAIAAQLLAAGGEDDGTVCTVMQQG